MAGPSLTSGPLPGHIRRIALPMSVGYFFNTMYNVVDSFYAGRISTEALAAMALSFPVFFIIIAISGGLSRGSSALIANAIGSKDKEAEVALSAQIFSLACISSAIVATIGLCFSTPLFQILGASGNYLEIATQYIRPLFSGALFFMLCSMMNAILLAHGDSKTYSRILIVGFFANLILDPWFLYGGVGLPAMGIRGIAWATVCIQALSALVLCTVVVKRGYVTLHCFHHLLPKWNIYAQILRQGIPTAFNLMSIALGFFVTTYFLKYFDHAAVAAFGVGTRIEQIALLPAIGISSAIVAIVGQNNGAGELDRVHDCVRLCLKYGIYLIITASLLLFVFAEPLVMLFTDDPTVRELGKQYVRIVACIQWAYVVGFVYIGFLQAMKRPMYGFIEAVIRKLLLPVIVFSIAVYHFDVNLTGFWIAMCAINVAMALVTVAYAESVLKKLR
ncbi:MATE family efflux transporter [Rubritalea sp.]|uniref:MATE family efflux transporter n=1 Tax=Rubritalea sp. TaxID=2109375 RepID=UPI003EF49C33